MVSRYYVEGIIVIINEVLGDVDVLIEDIDVIVVIEGFGLIGVLLIGVNVVKVLVFVYDKLFIFVYYIVGYIYVNYIEELLIFLLIVFIVLGGYIELVYMKDYLLFEVIGEIWDDVVGEVYDKVVWIIGLNYLGGL